MDPWEKLGGEPAFRGSFRKIDRVRFRLPDGKEKDFDILRAGEVVVAVALTSEKEVILTRQFRPGPEKVLLELPAGWKDPRETPEEAMRRELLEETGYSGQLAFIVTTPSSAYSDMRRHIFVAQKCTKVQEPEPDDSEFIEVVLMSLGAFREHLRSGQLTDVASGYLALDFLGLL